MEHKYRTNLEESTLPTAYRPWKKVFEQKASERFPERCPWDHGIELKDGVKVTFGCTRVALVRRQPQDNLGLLSL